MSIEKLKIYLLFNKSKLNIQLVNNYITFTDKQNFKMFTTYL
jgi:hypothetical protein